MSDRVAVTGIGFTALQPVTPLRSFKELTFEAAQKAYADAGVGFDQIDSFVTCAEDLNEGISIFDEYTPDQLGAVQKPMHTVTQDSLVGIADAVMQIRCGIAETVVVEAHSKASNVQTPDWVLDYALDPIYNRPLGFSPHAIAALEMNLFLQQSGITPDDCAAVVAKNRTNALANPIAAYPQAITPFNVSSSAYFAFPLREAEMARHADGAVVIVLANEAKASKSRAKPVWILGAGFANDSATIESRNWGEASYARIAAKDAYKQAQIEDSAQIDFFELDDTYAYKELQHFVALGLCKEPTEAAQALRSGATQLAGKTPVNISGGALGMGLTFEAAGLYRIVELVLQLRGQAGPRQLARAKVGLAQSWRGVPTTSGAVVILGAE